MKRKRKWSYHLSNKPVLMVENLFLLLCSQPHWLCFLPRVLSTTGRMILTQNFNACIRSHFSHSLPSSITYIHESCFWRLSSDRDYHKVQRILKPECVSFLRESHKIWKLRNKLSREQTKGLGSKAGRSQREPLGIISNHHRFSISSSPLVIFLSWSILRGVSFGVLSIYGTQQLLKHKW